MKKIYYLSTCDTCKRIINELDLKNKDFEFIDIKVKTINEYDLNKVKDKVGSYENAFSKIARKYKEQNLSEKNLKEADYKKLILEEYTFLKRPVIFYNTEIFVGNTKSEMQKAKTIII